MAGASNFSHFQGWIDWDGARKAGQTQSPCRFPEKSVLPDRGL
jgi:hypothetical protein